MDPFDEVDNKLIRLVKSTTCIKSVAVLAVLQTYIAKQPTYLSECLQYVKGLVIGDNPNQSINP